MGLADVRVWVEHVGIGRRDVHIAADDRGVRVARDRLSQRGQPGELVPIVLGVRDPAVWYVYRARPDSAAGGRYRASLGIWEPGGAVDPSYHIVEAHP